MPGFFILHKGNMKINTTVYELFMFMNIFLICIFVVLSSLEPSWLTFLFKTLCPKEADNCQELSDLLQVDDRGVVQVDNGHGLPVVG